VWWNVIRAASEISEISRKNVTPDTVRNWCSSGHFRFIRYHHKSPVIRDDEVRIFAKQYRDGGRKYLFIFDGSDQPVLMTLRLFMDIAEMSPKKGARLVSNGALSGMRIGRRIYVETRSAAKQSPRVAEYLDKLGYPGDLLPAD
jgi:hypothetical protein